MLRERWWPGPIGAVLAVAVAVLGVVEQFLGTDLERPLVTSAVMVVVGIALFLRRLQPMATLAVAMGGLVIADVNSAYGTATSVFAVVVAATNVGLETKMPNLALGPAMVAVFVLLAVFGSEPFEPIDAIAMSLIYGGAIAVGVMFRRHTDRVAELAAKAALLEREREVGASQAVDAERARIARELHDIVSHSISVIAIQTQAVRRRLGDDHRAEADDLRAVETVARQAMAEMRRMLGILRSQGNALELEPQPGLGQLAKLLEQTRSAGLPVELRVEGKEAPLPPGIDLAAYRIIQEALTNIRKHAGPAQAIVTLRYGDHMVEIEVVDDGRGPSGTAVGGHGLLGMRERISVYGGTLEYGAVNGRGFRVGALLPVREEALP